MLKDFIIPSSIQEAANAFSTLEINQVVTTHANLMESEVALGYLVLFHAMMSRVWGGYISIAIKMT